MEALTDIDAKILEYIERNEPVSMDSIKRKFSKISAIEYRVHILSTPEYSYIPNCPISLPKANTSYLRESVESIPDGKGNNVVKHLGIYQLTERGKKELQNYRQTKSSAMKELWLKNAWIPIIVAFVTTVITNYMLPMLPQTLQWLSSILARIFS